MNPAPDHPSLAVNSAIEGIAWQLEQTQWWTPERIAERQGRQLKALLAHARTHVPFYRERLRGRDLPEDEGWLSAWRQIPALTRADIQASEADETMIADALPCGHGELREIYTSGSTGTPIRSVRTQLWELIWSAFTVRDHLWHRRDLGGKLAAIRESGKGKALYPQGATAPSWGYSSATIFATGPMVSLNVATPVEKQAEWLQRQNPDYLVTHPSLAHTLAAHCLEKGIRLPKLKQVMTIAENLRPEARKACRAAADGRGGERACRLDRAEIHIPVPGEIRLCRRPAAHHGRKIRGFFLCEVKA